MPSRKFDALINHLPSGSVPFSRIPTDDQKNLMTWLCRGRTSALPYAFEFGEDERASAMFDEEMGVLVVETEGTLCGVKIKARQLKYAWIDGDYHQITEESIQRLRRWSEGVTFFIPGGC